MKPAKFRKKPVVIEAMLFSGSNSSRLALVKWLGEGNVIMTNIGDDGERYERAHPLIKTLEGHMMVKEGDWVIKGVKGEFYPCKPDIFDQTYEAVPA